MNIVETSTLLAMCAAYDSRTVGEMDITAWQAALERFTFDDAKQAVVDHYREKRERIMPADITQAVRKYRSARLAKAEEVPDADPDDPMAYIAALRANRMKVADGLVEKPVAALIATVARSATIRRAS